MDSTNRIESPTFSQRLEGTSRFIRAFSLQDKIKQVALFIFEQLAYIYKGVISSLRTLFTYSTGRTNREVIEQVISVPSHQIETIQEETGKPLRQTPVGSVHDEIMAYIFTLAGDMSQIKAVCKDWQGITETHSYPLLLRSCESIIGEKQAVRLYEEMGQIESFCSKQRYRALVQDQIRQIKSLLIDDEAKDFFQQFPITQEVANFQQRQQWIYDCNLIIMVSNIEEGPLKEKASSILTQFKQGDFAIQQGAEEIRQSIKDGALQTCTDLRLCMEDSKLDQRRLTELSPEIEHLTNIDMFAIIHTPIRKLPKEITCLKKLQWLNIRRTRIRKLPQNISCLLDLKYLIITYTPIRKLPKKINCLVNLKGLYINHTQIRKLPKKISHLKNLRAIHIDSMQIKELSQDISRLTNLEELNINYTQMKEQPMGINDLINLKMFRISPHQISNLPEEISRLTNLKRLNISYSQISELPEEVRHLLSLTRGS